MFLGPEASPRESRWRTIWLKMALEQLQDLIKIRVGRKIWHGALCCSPRTAQNVPKMPPRMLRNTPRSSQNRPRWPQGGPILHQDGPKLPQKDPKCPQDVLEKVQDGARWFPDRYKMSKDCLLMVQEGISYATAPTREGSSCI